MIESINQAGGAGGGVQSVVAGTGISVDNTDPENPIVNSAGIDTDEKAKVSANDTTAGYLNGKLVAGSGIGFTENNNGGNETLTVAVSNLDAGAITTGTIATARLGTGTASSSTYLKGDQTYSGIDAGHITTGTVGTARLATGTANSSTYLRGDQTWASVSAGTTYYPITVNDMENTSALVDMITFTIPANSLAVGEVIWVEWWTQSLQFSGSNATITNRIEIGGSQLTSINNVVSSSGIWTWRFFRLPIWRIDSSSIATQEHANDQSLVWWNYYSSYSSSSNFGRMTTSPRNFTNNLTVKIQLQSSVANANIWSRIQNAVVYKHSEQKG